MREPRSNWGGVGRRCYDFWKVSKNGFKSCMYMKQFRLFRQTNTFVNLSSTVTPIVMSADEDCAMYTWNVQTD